MRALLCLLLLAPAALAQAPDPPPPDVPVVTPTPMKLPPEPPAEPAPPAEADREVTVTYNRGLTFASRDDKFGLRIQFRNQLRFETTRPTEDNSQFESHFSIPRARLTVDGHVFGERTRYKLESTFGDTGSFSFIRDLYIDQQLSSASVWLRAGVWKRPFNRQELVSDFASEFNERAITAAFAGGGRDLGLAVHNDYERSPEGLEWVVGVFNSFSGGAERPDIGGCGTDMAGVTECPPPTNFPDDFGPTIVARAGWNSGDIKGYAEGDLGGGPLRWAAGAAYKIDLANIGEGDEASVADNLSHGVQVDGMLKVWGVSAQAGVYMMKLKTADAGFGAFGQLGYMVVLERVQVAGRFAFAPAPRDPDRDQLEARIAVNLFWQGHAWKWATDAGVLKTTGEDPMTLEADEPDFVLRSMLQLTL